MAQVDSTLPGEAELLCEGCGYSLSGLAGEGRCPECGRAIAESLPGRRGASAFEARPAVWTLLRTTGAVLFRPGRFFRGLSAREGGRAGVWFGRVHRGLAAALLAVAASGHVVADGGFKNWLRGALTPAGGVPTYETFTVNLFGTRFYWADAPTLFGLMLAPLAVGIYGLMVLIEGLAARAAAGRGGRRRRAVMRRALGFHLVHWVPVGLFLAGTVCGYIGLIEYGYLKWRPGRMGLPGWRAYVAVMASEVVVGVAYLLATGWVAIGRMRYANVGAGVAGGEERCDARGGGRIAE